MEPNKVQENMIKTATTPIEAMILIKIIQTGVQFMFCLYTVTLLTQLNFAGGNQSKLVVNSMSFYFIIKDIAVKQYKYTSANTNTNLNFKKIS